MIVVVVVVEVEGALSSIGAVGREVKSVDLDTLEIHWIIMV